MRKLFLFLFLAGFSLLVSSCSSVPGTKAPIHSSVPQAINSNGTSTTSPINMPSSSINNMQNQNQNQQESALERQAKEVMQRIYFKVNSASITNINKWGIQQNPSEVLDKIASFLIDHSEINIVIEGNCDERGTDAYNLALGQQRADAAKNYLILKGVSADRIQTLSNGKSKPVDSQNNEYAWAKNRNDEFVSIIKK
ncbi:peptidoglycan-associated outer membrane lipoproteinn P6, OmpA/MotB precursor [Desulfurella amilsii]|uniref:Peptidoglycan-associated lipoprotein n=1 Tax=Desulfurella amilsii TaxID=1562698 RepID=A0A1X4XW42_9BACT|nr:OmpA family protein [Desulfurella amilsii]OSS41753.1 peptidoglycan-associated outer membrane lipoproteinn P6, OmpA/MotB precursor [Desulfurella amilsii]